jgi:hypothetical protein
MPKKLSPEEATVMIIRRRLQQMEEAKMADRKNAGKPTAANDDDIDLGSTGSPNTRSASTGSPGTESQNAADELPKD